MASLQKTSGSRVVRSERQVSNPPSPLPEKIALVLQESRWLALIVLAAFLGLALSGYNRADPGWSHAMQGASLHNPAGRGGAWLADLLLYLFGLSAWWWIALFAVFVFWGVRRLRDEVGDYEPHPLYLALFGFTFLIVASASLEALRFYSLKAELPLGPGGVLGIELSRVLGTHLGYTGATVLLLALIAFSWSLFTGMSWLWAFEQTGFILERFVGFFYGRVDTWRDRQIG